MCIETRQRELKALPAKRNEATTDQPEEVVFMEAFLNVNGVGVLTLLKLERMI